MADSLCLYPTIYILLIYIQGPLQEHEGDSPGNQEDAPEPRQEVSEERHRQEGDRSIQKVG